MSGHPAVSGLQLVSDSSSNLGDPFAGAGWYRESATTCYDNIPVSSPPTAEVASLTSDPPLLPKLRRSVALTLCASCTALSPHLTQSLQSQSPYLSHALPWFLPACRTFSVASAYAGPPTPNRGSRSSSSMLPPLQLFLPSFPSSVCGTVKLRLCVRSTSNDSRLEV